MPTYEYVCEDDHVTEQRGKLDEDTIQCLNLALLVGDVSDGPRVPVYCKKLAKRRPAYLSQGVVFPGTGFTRTIIPPAKPRVPKTAGNSAGTAFEQLDEYAEKQYKDDVNYEPERRKIIKKAEKVVERGGLL